MVSKYLAKRMREHGHHHIKANNTTLRDLQENADGQSPEERERWKKAVKEGKLKEYYGVD